MITLSSSSLLSHPPSLLNLNTWPVTFARMSSKCLSIAVGRKQDGQSQCYWAQHSSKAYLNFSDRRLKWVRSCEPYSQGANVRNDLERYITDNFSILFWASQNKCWSHLTLDLVLTSLGLPPHSCIKSTCLSTVAGPTWQQSRNKRKN